MITFSPPARVDARHEIRTKTDADQNEVICSKVEKVAFHGTLRLLHGLGYLELAKKFVHRSRWLTPFTFPKPVDDIAESYVVPVHLRCQAGPSIA